MHENPPPTVKRRGHLISKQHTVYNPTIEPDNVNRPTDHSINNTVCHLYCSAPLPLDTPTHSVQIHVLQRLRCFRFSHLANLCSLPLPSAPMYVCPVFCYVLPIKRAMMVSIHSILRKCRPHSCWTLIYRSAAVRSQVHPQHRIVTKTTTLYWTTKY